MDNEFNNDKKLKKIAIDKESLMFLYSVYFGRYQSNIDAASNRAYLDMNRTIRFRGFSPEKRIGLRNRVTALLEKSIQEINNKSSINQNVFDEWHRKTCEKIIGIYQVEELDFFFGQAQKWLNMTLKYLYILGDKSVEKLFQYCHVPIDNYIFNVAKKRFDIQKPEAAWSRWTDYSGQYMSYQKQLRQSITDVAPLRWEFSAWLEEAKGRWEE